MKKLSKRFVAPEYLRIPHLDKDISNMTHDDITLDTKIKFPLTGYVGEKVDGANCGMSFMEDAPILRNREHILKKGYSDIHTPSKKQFTSAWNWLHKHKDNIDYVTRKCESPITIYGEWMYAQHSIPYDKLPDLFIAYDIWSVNDNSFLSPKIVQKLLSKTKISFIKSELVTFNNIEEVVAYSERPSEYRDGMREGIVIKQNNEFFCTNMFKVVNRHFERRTDFNEKLIKNKLG